MFLQENVFGNIFLLFHTISPIHGGLNADMKTRIQTYGIISKQEKWDSWLVTEMCESTRLVLSWLFIYVCWIRARVLFTQWASCQMRKNYSLCMRRECRESFPRHRLQWKPPVSDSSMNHGTCVTHVPWCMSGSLTYAGGEIVPGIPGACATRNYTYLARGPYVMLEHVAEGKWMCTKVWLSPTWVMD